MSRMNHRPLRSLRCPAPPSASALTLGALAAAAVGAGPASADTTVATDATAQNVTAYGSTAAWSRRAADGYHLVISHNGTIADAPVPGPSKAYDPARARASTSSGRRASSPACSGRSRRRPTSPPPASSALRRGREVDHPDPELGASASEQPSRPGRPDREPHAPGRHDSLCEHLDPDAVHERERRASHLPKLGSADARHAFEEGLHPQHRARVLAIEMRAGRRQVARSSVEHSRSSSVRATCVASAETSSKA